MSQLLTKVKRKMEYARNRLEAYDYPPEQGGWVKHPGAVFGDETTASVFDPFVLRMEEGYRLYVSERKNSGIICADSVDGVHWGQWQRSLSHSEVGSWEERVNRACVCRVDGKWMMWYTGQSTKKSAIGLAVSEDGIRFHRVGIGPVLQPELPWEQEAVMNPCVLWEDGIFRIWYAAGEQFEPDVICYGESLDGIAWKKYEKHPIMTKSSQKYRQHKVGGCHILQKDGKYYMFYIGYQNVDTARICVAESDNGIDGWKQCNYNPILSPGKNTWDADAVYKPTVVVDYQVGKMMLWYNGRRKKSERIGMAEHPLD